MDKIKLKSPPLIEAIFDIRWQLQDIGPNLKKDPKYKILIGRIYDKLLKDYPYYEELPTSFMPEEISVYIVQHRFRKNDKEWPLIQLGPGIMTLNDTKKYKWTDFYKRINDAVKALLESYPENKNFKIDLLILRYVNAIEFDFNKSNIFEFLKNNFNINIDINKKIFTSKINDSPENLDLNFSFVSNEPEGNLNLRFSSGKINNKDFLIWENHFQSNKNNVPQEINTISKWVENAHNLLEKCFFEMISKNLLRRFKQ